MKSFLFCLSVSIALLALSACSAATPTVPVPTPIIPTTTSVAVPSPVIPTSTSVAQAVLTPAGTWFRAGPPSGTITAATAHDCELVTRHDAAGFFSGETSQPVQAVKTVDHPIFSQDKVPAFESSCLLYTYNVSAKKTGHSYQITYWVDRPAQNEPDQWAKLWTDAKAQGAQQVTGIGDEAIFSGNILTFRKGDVYVSAQVLRMDSNEQITPSDQLEMDKKVAIQAASRLK